MVGIQVLINISLCYNAKLLSERSRKVGNFSGHQYPLLTMDISSIAKNEESEVGQLLVLYWTFS